MPVRILYPTMFFDGMNNNFELGFADGTGNHSNLDLYAGANNHSLPKYFTQIRQQDYFRSDRWDKRP